MLILNLSAAFKVLHVHGEKSAEFLQGQLTNDVKQASNDALQWQAYCNRQGLIQSMFGLWGSGSDYYLLIAQDLVDITLVLLQKYGVFSKIQCCVLSPTVSLTLENQAEKNLVWTVQRFSSDELQLLWRSQFTEATLPDAFMMRLQFIQHGFPWLCEKTSNLFRPHDLNLPELGVVNFQKGCYPGQEIIARTQYRGKPKQKLIVRVEEGRKDFQPGQLLMEEGRQVGQVVDAITCASTTYITSAMSLKHENDAS